MAECEVAKEVINKRFRKDDAPGEMKPWEQHSAVISIPRYDYKAPASFLDRSFSGFLITCPIKREKSATKEAMSILNKYLGSINTCGSEQEEDPQNVVTKRRKVVNETEEECTNDIENKILDENTDANTERSDPLSLIKLTRSGLLLLTFSHDNCPDVVAILSNIMQSLESSSLKAPLWCNRILPIQMTCVLHEKELCILVSKLVADFMNNEGKDLNRPIKFAVGYNSRGIEETELKGGSGMLDRSKCFEVVAGAVKSIVSDSVVDLKCPELTVLVELLPISGLPKGSPVGAVSVLPRKLIMAKPRLCIKALVHDVKSKD
ncbi:uncharacterized protein LOC111918179 [Lactuca sativa]|uniref:uncharacterized protein LOC111918179 n=1 Tax=Lactuca sativa TaxID=4236 RepID=UPI000CD82747|nr:uncharacterized protein LOC111918179 [Lactuca sativa]